VQGTGFRIEGSGFRFRVQVHGSGFRVQGSRYMVPGSGVTPVARQGGAVRPEVVVRAPPVPYLQRACPRPQPPPRPCMGRPTLQRAHRVSNKPTVALCLVKLRGAV